MRPPLTDNRHFPVVLRFQRKRFSFGFPCHAKTLGNYSKHSRQEHGIQFHQGRFEQDPALRLAMLPAASDSESLRCNSIILRCLHTFNI